MHKYTQHIFSTPTACYCTISLCKLFATTVFDLFLIFVLALVIVKVNHNINAVASIIIVVFYSKTFALTPASGKTVAEIKFYMMNFIRIYDFEVCCRKSLKCTLHAAAAAVAVVLFVAVAWFIKARNDTKNYVYIFIYIRRCVK